MGRSACDTNTMSEQMPVPQISMAMPLAQLIAGHAWPCNDNKAFPEGMSCASSLSSAFTKLWL